MRTIWRPEVRRREGRRRVRAGPVEDRGQAVAPRRCWLRRWRRPATPSGPTMAGHCGGAAKRTRRAGRGGWRRRGGSPRPGLGGGTATPRCRRWWRRSRAWWSGRALRAHGRRPRRVKVRSRLGRREESATTAMALRSTLRGQIPMVARAAWCPAAGEAWPGRRRPTEVDVHGRDAAGDAGQFGERLDPAATEADRRALGRARPVGRVDVTGQDVTCGLQAVGGGAELVCQLECVGRLGLRWQGHPGVV